MTFTKKNIKFLILIIILILLLCYIYNYIEIYTNENNNSNKLLKSLEVYYYPLNNKLRLGEKGDGGYIIGDIGNIYDCYISAGVSNEESFTKDFINKYNIDLFNCFAFDGTIENYPYNYTKNILFIKKNINNFNDEHNTNLFSLINKYNNIFLKMDIEGGEIPWILSLNNEQLNKFKQIVIEFHGINDDTWNATLNDKITCLEKIANTHYLIHAHGNNNSLIQNKIPDVIELTYIHKSLFNIKPTLNTTLLPINDLDFPNRLDKNDINLSFYPFLIKN
jgi:hypothetical protein